MPNDAERLAYWYLRLNGFLTIPSFIVHPDRGRNQETDVDVVGIRLPHRAENLLNPMQDDPALIRSDGKAYLVLVEVKAGTMRLNGPWTNPERGNMLRVLRAIGPFPSSEAEVAAGALYSVGEYEGEVYRVSLVCMGAEADPIRAVSHPRVPQITWDHALAFVYRRFRDYRHQKISHGQWDRFGRDLWRATFASRTEAEFIASQRPAS